jgi:plastocyanin
VSILATSGPSVFTSQFPLQSVKALVLIQGNTFIPSSLTVAAGTRVYWLNLDASGGGDVNAVAHDVTALDGSFSSGTSNLQQYAVYSFTFTKAGTFKYDSSAQPTMTGQVVVTG